MNLESVLHVERAYKLNRYKHTYHVRENKKIQSGGLWFSYKNIAVLQHTRNERNLFLERNRPDRSYGERRALSGKFTVKFS